MKRKRTLALVCVAAVLTSSFVMGSNAKAATIYLEDIDSRLTSPDGGYRWLDVADQAYSDSYRSSYNYTQATVEIVYDTIGNTLHGTLTAADLKPNFAYQLKLAGNPEIDAEANERIGLVGRWWQEEWNGTEWTNGQNLNNKGDGSFPSPNDLLYFARRDVEDLSSPTGLHYRYTGYLVFDYFITDESGDAILYFAADSSYHVLWKTSQRTPTSADGPLYSSTFDPDPTVSWAYDVDYPSNTVGIFGEWERLPVGGVFPAPGDYLAQIILTEESFHGSGGTYAGNWAGAMASPIDFSIVTGDVVTIITAEYKAKPHQLLVEAASSAQPDALLTIDVDGVDYGMMTFDSANAQYVFRGKIYDLPEHITVTSNQGGSAAIDLGETPNKPPVADAGGDYQVTDNDGDGVEAVVLDGSGSFDPDGTLQAYVWQEDGVVLGSSASLEHAFSLGAHTVSLTVTDDMGAAAGDTTIVSFLSPSADTVAILRAEYVRKTKQLLVQATSSSQPYAALTLEGYGSLTFSSSDSTYIFDSQVKNFRKGDTVTVSSSYGGKATALVRFQ
jgi:hypothetical protein